MLPKVWRSLLTILFLVSLCVNTFSLQAEESVSQPTAQTCIVTKKEAAGDSGPGTLRQCLLDAMAGMTISFSTVVFPADTPTHINLASPLPPIITNDLMIDGSNSRVFLNGAALSDGSGLEIKGATGVKIRGITIGNFQEYGILIYDGASDNEIGGDRAVGDRAGGQGVTLLWNKKAGLGILNARTKNNLVVGSIIFENYGSGIQIRQGATNNFIGSPTANLYNEIYANNQGDGIWLRDPNTQKNYIFSNIIGTGNLRGITISDGASYNYIGGSLPGEGNLISGNFDQGIRLTDEGTSNNEIIGNLIGTDITGQIALGNGLGVLINNGAKYNIVGGPSIEQGNLVSGNGNGIVIEGTGTTSNRLRGNFIGTNISGIAPILPQQDVGVIIGEGATGNFIGGTEPGEGNVISSNKSAGIQIEDNGTQDNQVLGNFIGTDLTGTQPLSNTNDGIVIGYKASYNIIGGEMPGARNIISSNGDEGIVIQDIDTIGNKVLGNYIGTDVTGKEDLGNTTDGILLIGGPSKNEIGGTNAAARNIISGNGYVGILLRDPGTQNNRIIGNYIGTDVTGSKPLGNTNKGIVIMLGANGNFIGDSISGGGNVISSNGDDGIKLEGEGTNDNKIWGNYIGTDATGVSDMGNIHNGIIIMDGAQGNEIGGNEPISRNLISGNGYAGVLITGTETSRNVIQGNFIGTNTFGNKQLANDFYGVFLGRQTHDNRIGGLAVGSGNLISGNNVAGIWLQDTNTSGNLIEGNFIGSDITGKSPLPNHKYGVFLHDGANGNKIGISNTIAFNLNAGVVISGVTTLGNTITRNSIHSNNLMQIRWFTSPVPIGPNSGLELLNFSATMGMLTGRACGNCKVEIFGNPTASASGTTFLGSTNANAEGSFTFTVNSASSWQYLSATQIQNDGTTSEFSRSIERTVEITATPTPTATQISPTLTSTPTPTSMPSVYLPVVIR